ncbi:hypothetical protein JCM19237_4944 [Photobacterium aphoticum]|uniref:Uncharacterized protein n=1 Tax=Photobacterium aphoticum TaxID=754436 RepID=A0A090QSJ7_9GAMM|nr:hypothetical protein JCM19237_4944 [Photobacterium aphoticum]
MEKEQAVDRQDFDEVMVPCYAPMQIVPVKGQVPPCGIRADGIISILPVGSR